MVLSSGNGQLLLFASAFRRSSPDGGAAAHGLYFRAFAADLERHEFLSRRRYGESGDSVHDRLTEFTRPLTGSYRFAPSQGDLDGVSGVA